MKAYGELYSISQDWAELISAAFEPMNGLMQGKFKKLKGLL